MSSETNQHFEAGPQTSGRWPARLTGPGAIYNVGNVLALAAGIGLNLREVWGEPGFAVALRDHLIGSPEATWLTSAMVLFLIAGEVYHQAYSSPAKSNLVAWGDFVAGLAAIALTVALVMLGDTAAALLAGFMLTVGKLGSAVVSVIFTQSQDYLDRLLRLLVVASRAPSILALGMAVLPVFFGGVPLDAVLLPLIMILCFFLWLWADLLLMRG